MRGYTADIFGTPRTHMDFYTGNNINSAVVMLLLSFTTVLLHTLDGKSARPFAVMLGLFGVAEGALAFWYFFPGPAVPCLVGGTLLLVSAMLPTTAIGTAAAKTAKTH